MVKIIIVPRCWSCGKPVGQFYEEFKERKAKGEKVKKILDDFGLERYCCRGIFLAHIDLINTIAQFKKP